MEYNGALYGKIGRRYVKLKQTSDYVDSLEKENARLREAAQAVINRWDSPLWKDEQPTAAVINRLRDCVINARNAAEAIINGEQPLSIAEALLDNCNDTLDT